MLDSSTADRKGPYPSYHQDIIVRNLIDLIRCVGPH